MIMAPARSHLPHACLTRTPYPTVPPWGHLPYKLPFRISLPFQFWPQFLRLPLVLSGPGLRRLERFIKIGGPPHIVFCLYRYWMWPLVPSCPPVPQDPLSYYWNCPWSSGPFPSPLRTWHYQWHPFNRHIPPWTVPLPCQYRRHACVPRHGWTQRWTHLSPPHHVPSPAPSPDW